jgi:integrase
MLTENTIKRTKCDPIKRITLTDGQGLQLRITQRDIRSWSFQYRFRGAMKKMSLGTWPSVNCAKARKLANEARYTLAQGIDPQEAKRKAEVSRQRLSEIWDLYDALHIEKNVKEKTAKDYRRSASKDILPVLGKLYIDEVEKASIVKLIDNIQARAPVLANRTLGLTKHFLNWCVGRGYIAHNPAQLIPKPLRETPRQRILSLAEMRKLYEASQYLSKGNRLFLRLLLLTGQREGVIAKLSQSELKNDHLEIQGERNKSGQRILIPMSPVALQQIEELGQKNSEFIVSNTGGFKPISGFSKLKRKVDELSGVRDWRFHDIRRGIATHLEDNGVDRFYVERVLTHKDRSVTGIYARSNHLDVRRTILNQWALVLTAPEGFEADNVVSFTGPVT